MKNFELPKKTLLLWQIRVAIIALLLFVACAFFSISRIFLLAETIVIVSVALFAALWYMPRYFKSCKICYVNQSVVINRGVFLKSTHILPFSKIIHTQTVTTPLAAAFSLTAVGLKAARMRIYIPEITLDDAKLLIFSLTKEEFE